MGYTPGQGLGGMQVDLGPIPLGRVDAAGVAWSLQDLQGWDSPEIRADVQQRSADHGAWAAPVYLGERPITLAGTVTAPDWPSLDAAREQLLAAASLTDTTITVYEATPKQALARRSGKPLWAYVTNSIATYSVLMTAQDPRRYAVNQQSVQLSLPSVSGGLTFPIQFPITFPATVVVGDSQATNAGSFETRPTIRIAGPVSQPQVTVTAPDGTAATLLYGGDIAAGDWLTLDCDAHTVYYNGTANRRSLLTGAWPVLPPGTSGLAFRAGAYSAAATATFTFRSAWM